MAIGKKIIHKWSGIVYIVCLLILMYLKPEFYEPLNDRLISKTLIVYIVVVLVHFINTNPSNWFRIDVFFILGFTIVHLQWPIMYAFSDIIPDNYWRIFVDDNVVNFTTWISTLGGLMFILGFHLYQKSSSKAKLIPRFNYKRLLYF